jgi:hypothetical protein
MVQHAHRMENERYFKREWQIRQEGRLDNEAQMTLGTVSYGYDHQHNNKAEYLQVKTKRDVDMCLTYLIYVILLYCCVDGDNHKILYTQQDAIYKA